MLILFASLTFSSHPLLGSTPEACGDTGRKWSQHTVTVRRLVLVADEPCHRSRTAAGSVSAERYAKVTAAAVIALLRVQLLQQHTEPPNTPLPIVTPFVTFEANPADHADHGRPPGHATHGYGVVWRRCDCGFGAGIIGVIEYLKSKASQVLN